MADETELRELSERIARLSRRELVRLLDMALDVEDRARDELRADILAGEAAFREAEKRELAATEEWHRKQQRSTVPVEERTREAG